MKTTLTPEKVSKKGQQVDTHHVDQLVRNYKKERWVQNTKNLGKVDSLSTWYGMDELQSFLQLARENQADGIKMYYGVYPEDYPAVPEFGGRQTVVLVATKKKTTDHGIVNKDIYIQKDGIGEILAFNVGQLCPPWCGNDFPPEGGPYGIEMEKIGISILEQDNKIIVL